MKHVREIINNKSFKKHINVNNVNKNIFNNVKELNVNVSEDDKNEKINYCANIFATYLNDFKSLNYYRKLFREYSEGALYECLSIVKETESQGKIRTTPAQYFVGVVKRKFGK